MYVCIYIYICIGQREWRLWFLIKTAWRKDQNQYSRQRGWQVWSLMKTSYRILINTMVSRGCRSDPSWRWFEVRSQSVSWSKGVAGLIPHADELEIRYRSVYIGQRGWRVWFLIKTAWRKDQNPYSRQRGWQVWSLMKTSYRILINTMVSRGCRSDPSWRWFEVRSQSVSWSKGVAGLIPHAGELKVEGTFPRDIVVREGGGLDP